MSQVIHILHLEDDASDTELATRLLRDAGMEVEVQRVQDLRAFEIALGRVELGLILSDYTVPTADSLQALRLAHARRPDVPFVFFSGTIREAHLAIEQVVVVNRPGAGGTIGSDIVAKSAPDGYTIQMATSSTHSIGPSLNPKIPYNALTDFTPIAHVADSANVLVIAPTVKAANVTELIAVFKAQPGGYNYGSSGNGMIVHLTGELFKSMTGTYVVHIPYRGTALVIPDMVTGQIHLLFDNIASALPHLKDGKLRALAVTSAKRSPLLPELPTVAETVSPLRYQ